MILISKGEEFSQVFNWHDWGSQSYFCFCGTEGDS